MIKHSFLNIFGPLKLIDTKNPSQQVFSLGGGKVFPPPGEFAELLRQRALDVWLEHEDALLIFLKVAVNLMVFRSGMMVMGHHGRIHTYVYWHDVYNGIQFLCNFYSKKQNKTQSVSKKDLPMTNPQHFRSSNSSPPQCHGLWC